MSVLAFPRIYLSGQISWDPIVSNNGGDYDGVRAEARFRPGETVEQFRARLIGDAGDWNYFGTHRCAMEDTTVSGGQVEPHAGVVEADAVVGTPVGLVGKLVDIDPAGVFSQIFFDELTIGLPGRARLRARPLRRLSSRWLHFGRNSGPGLVIAGGASAAWQTVFPRDGVELHRTDESPLLAAIEATLDEPGALGLMLRMSTYRTIYFQNGVLNSLEPAPDQAALQQLHRAGVALSNPAYSRVVAAVGIWSAGDGESVPSGRVLTTRLVGANGRSRFGPAVAELDEAAGLLSLDLANALPETTVEAEKVDLGTLTVHLASDGGNADIGELPFDRYNRLAYQRQAGIVDIDLRDRLDALTALRAGGTLSVRAATAAGPVVVLGEDVLTAWSEDCNVYLDEPRGGVDGTTVTVQVRDRGRPPSGGASLLVATYTADGDLTLVEGSEQHLEVSATGTAKLAVPAGAPGFRHFRFLPFATADPPAPEPVVRSGSALLTTLQLTTVRTLPADDALETSTSDEALTWEFIFRTVLLTYDAIAPRMSNIIDLGDEDAVRTFARRFLDVVDDGLFESARYMPVTRDLSRGKRVLLRRYCQRLLDGAPAEPPAPFQATPPAADADFSAAELAAADLGAESIPFSKRARG